MLTQAVPEVVPRVTLPWSSRAIKKKRLKGDRQELQRGLPATDPIWGEVSEFCMSRYTWNLQLDNGNGNCHTGPPLDCPLSHRFSAGLFPVAQVLRWIVPCHTGSPLDCLLSHRFSAGLPPVTQVLHWIVPSHTGSALDCPLSHRFSAGLSPVAQVLRWIVPCHTCSPLDCPLSRVLVVLSSSDHANHDIHRPSELAAKREKWNHGMGSPDWSTFEDS